MKLTKTKLKEIIREEMVNESDGGYIDLTKDIDNVIKKLRKLNLDKPTFIKIKKELDKVSYMISELY
jgi:hypothetical protein